MNLPEDEFEWRFETSGGPGGQHANRAATRVVLRFDVAASRAFDDETKDRILSRIGDPVVVVSVDDSRSQHRNRVTAVQRLEARLAEAARPEPAERRPTKPSRAARRRRVESKRRRGQTKRLRRRPRPDD